MTDINALRAAYQEARLRAPHWNSYRLATALGVSEGELMAARLDDTDTLGEEVHGLALTACDLALALPRLGRGNRPETGRWNGALNITGNTGWKPLMRKVS